jgi:hypothetical protein
MGLLDIFRRGKPANLPDNETRSSGSGYTAAIMAARQSYISGVSGLSELTATVQACVSLWEAGFSLADVRGTDLLTRAHMALVARSVALRGEAVMLITGDGLVPCSDWDISTRNGIPRAYRLSVSEAGGGRRETALAGEVLHLRIGSDMVAPWTGSAPLRRASLTASLLQEVETALRDVYRDAPLGTLILPLPDGSSDDMEVMRGSFRGRRGSTLVVEGVAQAVAAGQHPQIGQKPDQISPDLSKSMTAETLAAARDSICGVFGVLPGLMNPATTGPMVREAQRHLAQLVLQPMAMLLAEEATGKLGAKITVDCVRPMQAFDAGGKARALATMMQALAQAKEAGIEGATLQDALSFIDWQEE